MRSQLACWVKLSHFRRCTFGNFLGSVIRGSNFLEIQKIITIIEINMLVFMTLLVFSLHCNTRAQKKQGPLHSNIFTCRVAARSSRTVGRKKKRELGIFGHWNVCLLCLLVCFYLILNFLWKVSQFFKSSIKFLNIWNFVPNF